MCKYIKYEKCLLIYKIYMLVYLLFAFNSFINGQTFMKYATLLAAGAGALLLLGVLVRWKEYRKMGNCVLLILFLLSYLFSSVMNIKYGVMENVQEMVWLTCQMGLLYIASYKYSADMIKKELRILGWIWIAVCTVFNIVSLSMIGWMFNRDYVDSQGGVHAAGYRLGRLWGVYDDPNHGSVIAVIAILFAVYLWRSCQKIWQKCALALTVAVQFSYIGFGNSRTAIIALAAGIGIWCFGIFYIRKKAVLQSLLAALAVVILCAGGFFAFEEANIQTYSYVQKLHTEKNTDKLANKDKQNNQKSQRKKELEEDESNGRIDIWKSGLEIAGTSPVYGVSFRNMTPYTKENLPDTFIISNPVVEYDSLHNIVIDVLACQGVIGLLISLLLAANTIRILVRGAGKTDKGHSMEMVFFLSVIAAMTAASMFYTYVFYLHSPQTYIFWLCMGYIVSMAQHANEKGSEAVQI